MKRAVVSVASLACVCLVLLALSRNGDSELTVKTEVSPIRTDDSSVNRDDSSTEENTAEDLGKQMIPRGKDTKLQFIPQSWQSNSSFLDAVPKVGNIAPALDGFVPHLDKVKVPDTWAGVRKMFGAHLDWAFLILLLAVATWGYVRYIRPKLNKGTEEGFVLDENDTTASLLLLPEERLLFRGEEPATQSW